jgi:hypothetical protein
VTLNFCWLSITAFKVELGLAGDLEFCWSSITAFKVNGFHELEGTGLKSDHHLKFSDVVLTEDKHCDQPLQVHECVFPSLSSAWCDKQPTSLWRLKSRLWKWLLEQHDFREISLQLIPLAMHPWSESPGAY